MSQSEACHIEVMVQSADFSQAELYERLRADSPAIGAICSFVGLMRDFNQASEVRSMFLEHYPGMTEKVLQDIARQASERWQLRRIVILHRVGELLPSDQIVFVGVSGTHRGEAFAACEFIMDFLKTKAPFWKREQTDNGQRWVDARDSDQQAADRWR
ncbi:molybdopterin synthase catalytic subunit MoaE [Pseudomaricurvus sp. HS19]|uniref:molybdopterin synthase catalytic subunit MoaE n=1 Tax=Pseudomaricurvus sp. HS19 TaxID=2692626 RepID=UPI0013683FAD|nr:molybdopterin synthase catalytic subunit MoaE [Pseudomaricurvus sp. HS19]MYM63075.1 molybdopterin synthase catalytic subunit MoaE [Pseudomaricurvus sp. HS19]